MLAADPDLAPPRGSGPRQRWWRRLGRRAFDVAVDGLFDVGVGLLVCAVTSGLVALLVWGWSVHPRSTVAVGAALLGVLAYAARALTLARREERGQVAAVAPAVGAFALVVLVWVGYLLSYCACA